MARLVALVACLAAGAGSIVLGGTNSRVTWFAGPARLLSPTFGYAVAAWQRRPGDPAYGFGGGLYLYRDGRWSKIMDTNPDGGIEDAAFPDERHGWVATYDCARALVSVYRTGDGGTTWVRLAVKTSHSCGGGPTYLSFPNALDGWLEPVSPNGPGGGFLITTNGGLSWPRSGELGEGACLNRITALSASTAWMSCGRLLRTSDGGKAWRPQVLPLPDRWRKDTVTSAGDPRFFGRHGVVAVSVWSRGPKAVLFYTSEDAGRTWSYRAGRGVAGFCERTFPWPAPPRAAVGIASPTTWWIVSSQSGRMDVTRDGGHHWASYATLTLRRLGWCKVSAVAAGSATLGWVTSTDGRAPLYDTRDGGRTWRPVRLPLR